MRLDFDINRSAQAAGFLVRNSTRPLTYGELVKLLYLADRRALQETGRSVTGDRPISMEHGPVLSEALNLARGLGRDDWQRVWTEFVIGSGGLGVAPGQESSVESLSAYDVRILKETLDTFGQMDFTKLRNYGHQLPEYTEVKPTDAVKSIPIDPADILRAAHVPEEAIEDFAAMALERAAVPPVS